MKVFELSNELNIKNADIIQAIKDTGAEIGNHFSVLTDEQEAMIREKFANVVKEEKKEVKKEKKVSQPAEQPKPTRKFVAGDMIPTRCVKGNKVIMVSPKTGVRYVWSEFNDVTEVDYADLISWRSSKSSLIYQPKIIIEDPELLELWGKDLKPIYEEFLGVENPEDYFKFNDEEFEHIMRTSSPAIQHLITCAATTLVKEGEFNSVRKIQIIDEVMGTILKEFL